MKIYLGTFFKIPLFLHVTWLIFVFFLMIFVGWIHVLSYIVMFFFVILHEYGHCLIAKRYNSRVLDITLYPIGGLANLKLSSNSPKQEFSVVIAGPMVNLVLALVFGILSVYVFTAYNLSQYKDFNIVPPPVEHPRLVAYCLFSFFSFSLVSNFFLFAFNMIPTFPMDGGRIFRAILHGCSGDFLWATYWAVRISQILCVILCVLFLIYGYFLTVFIFSLMIFFAQAELIHAKNEEEIILVKKKVANILDNPKLIHAPLEDVITAIANVEEPEVRAKLRSAELAEVLRDLLLVLERGLQR
jgi:Zn-dependent protease